MKSLRLRSLIYWWQLWVNLVNTDHGSPMGLNLGTHRAHSLPRLIREL